MLNQYDYHELYGVFHKVRSFLIARIFLFEDCQHCSYHFRYLLSLRLEDHLSFFHFVAMERFSIEQRILIVKTHYKNGRRDCP